ncbi:MAG TPA: 4-aminobutyrate--2-oxoglutarate transaminase [Candidatus Dormibacteraeota bacterium]|nr:4-aminobutyrate--2-oxoglutarate transaminase [Candidatus Dormibacteraeota bacterium]
MKTIQIRTEIPGPRSRALMARREAAIPRGLYHAIPVFAASAEGAVIEDVDGNRFIDFAGGIGCLNMGHRALPVTSAIRAQMEKYLHLCFSVTPYEPYVALAEKLNALAPGKFEKKTFIVNTGAEAVENSIKIARAYTKRPAVICFNDAFHGRTLLTMSLTSKTRPYKEGFEPFVNDIYRIPYAYCYRCSYNLTYPSCKMFCAYALEDAFKRLVAPESVAAIIVEPVLGEGGFVAPPKEFFSIIQKICRKHGIVFIADEVQSGVGRTGKCFAIEHYGIDPDIIITAKSLGGGLPIAAITGRAEIMDAPKVGGLGSTFAGNPASCAAALASLEIIEKGGLLERSAAIGRRFEERAHSWQKRWPLVGDVRGLGGMCAIELVRNAESREPADTETKEIAHFCYEHGLITITAGTYNNIMRILVPLVITDEQLDDGLAVIEAALASVADRKHVALSHV